MYILSRCLKTIIFKSNKDRDRQRKRGERIDRHEDLPELGGEGGVQADPRCLAWVTDGRQG